MPIFNLYDVKYSLGDMMYELLPRVYITEDGGTEQKTIRPLNEYGEPVDIVGGQLYRFLLLNGFVADKWLIKIQDAIDKIIDIDKCDAEMLPYIAKLVDADLSPFGTERLWRQHLRAQVGLLQQKGTQAGLKNFIRFYLGWECTIDVLLDTGYGNEMYGNGIYGGTSAEITNLKIIFPVDAWNDPQRAEKEEALVKIISKYLPMRVTYQIFYQTT